MNALFNSSFVLVLCDLCGSTNFRAHDAREAVQ